MSTNVEPPSEPPSEHSDANADLDDTSVVEYARRNGLSRNHLDEEMPLHQYQALIKDILDGLTSDSHLPQFNISADVDTNERLPVSKDAARLLAYLFQGETPDYNDSVILPLLYSNKVKSSRVELPLLRTDHELDCREFAKREGFEIKLKDIKLPLEELNIENNEGLECPARFMTFGQEALVALEREKIEVSREAMVYIQDALKVDFTEEDQQEVWGSLDTYKRNLALEIFTPPLSPIIPPQLETFVPSSPSCQVPVLSDPESPTEGELETIQKSIFNEDIPTPARQWVSTGQGTSSDSEKDHMELGDIYSPLASLDNMTSPMVETVRTNDHKIEEILTPPQPSSSSKSVHFNHIIEEMLLDSPQSTEYNLLEDRFFEEAFGKPAEQVNRQVEQEKLIEADSTARVEVPVMDFSLPASPWQTIQQTSNPAAKLEMQKNMIGDTVTNIPKTWAGAKRTHSKLRWSPFSHDLAKVVLEEHKIDDLAIVEEEEDLKRFICDPEDEDVITSSETTWKPEGLRILDEDDEDDDEIQPACFQTRKYSDMSSLIQKRKLEIEAQESVAASGAANGPNAMTRGSTAKSRKATQKLQSDPSDSLNLLGGDFSAANSLDNFLEMRGVKRPKLTESSYFKGRQETTASPPPQSPVTQLAIRKSPVPAEIEHSIEPLSVPRLNVPKSTIEIVVSCEILKQRSLFKLLQTTLPSLHVIERDFTRFNRTSWMPNSITRSPIASPLASEADFIVSSSTGIIITNLQKIKQKPLPGHKTKVAIRDRLEKVSIRYDKLIVLVSEARADETTNGFDENDTLAFAEFIGFTAGLPANVIVQFIAGGEETLSKWLTSAILQHYVPAEKHIPLVEDETHWELFLRRAGMNTFGAQSILADLKAPDGDTGSPTEDGTYGLVYFVEMDRDARKTMFGEKCGEGVIDRVSDMLDKPWK